MTQRIIENCGKDKGVIRVIGEVLAGFARMGMPASSRWTRERLGWRPAGPGLIEDLRGMDDGSSETR